MYSNTYGSISSGDRERNQFNEIVTDFSNIKLNPGDAGAALQSSPGSGGRLGPTPPPKPRKATEGQSPLYGNYSAASGRSALSDYYAINA
ncbi:hypothetical protein FHG87_018924, partial [Trinorchestia longiramus]